MSPGIGCGCGVWTGSPSPWTPAALASLEADWDPALAVIDTGKVASVPCIKSHTAQQTDPAKRPTIVTNGGFGILPSLLFDGTTWLDIATAISGISAGHVFAVLRAFSDPSDASRALWKFGSVGAGNTSHYPFTSGVVYDSFGASTRQTVGNPAQNLALAHCYEVVSKANSWTARINGTEIFTVAGTTVGWNASQQIANSAPDATSPWKGWIARLTICNAELTGADLASMRAYLTRYGVAFA